MPDGEHMMVLALGKTRSLDEPKWFVTPVFTYRYGITDRLDFILAREGAGVACTWDRGEATQLQLRGGLRFGAGGTMVDPADPDPRQPRTSGPMWMLAPGAGLTLRHRSSEDTAVLVTVGANHAVLFNTMAQQSRAWGGVALLWSPIERVTLALDLQFNLDRGDPFIGELFGPIVSVGGLHGHTSRAPPIAVRLTQNLDVLIMPHANWRARKNDLTYGLLIGIDWHWD